MAFSLLVYTMIDCIKKLKRQYINTAVINAISLKQFFLHLLRSWPVLFLNKSKACFPLNITLDLTYGCNLACEFCFINFLPNFDAGSSSDYLGKDEIRKIVGSVKKKNTSFFLTGGEPLLRNDLLEIVREIKNGGFKCGIFTNATLLKEYISGELINLKLDYLLFSLDGPREIHDSLRAKAGSFEKTIANIKKLIEMRGRQVRPRIIINSLVLDKNISCLREMVDIAKDLKVDCLAFDFLTFLNTKHFMEHKRCWDKLFPIDKFKSLVWVKDFSRSQFTNFYRSIKEVHSYAKKRNVKIFFKPDLNQREIVHWFTQDVYFKRRCIYPWNVMRVSPQGEVYPCAAFYLEMGNLKDSTIEEIWNNDKFINFRKTIRKEKMLSGCTRCVKL